MSKTSIWCEPGARHAHTNQFKHWIHIESDAPSYFIAPWPFAVHRRKPYGLDIDPGLLLAHWNISKFMTWPGEWMTLQSHMQHCIGYDQFWWGLFRSPNRNQLKHVAEHAVPKEFINALIGPRKAGR